MSEKAVAKTIEPERSEAAMLPAVDVIEDAGGITLYADLPGVPKDKLTLQ
ncbi:MAG: Hsp20/alpha crystallin family protein, partial [Rubrivivax sp.]|nr:Hsp20/alpha crystallin family protein [Rubrivivax sp.]